MKNLTVIRHAKSSWDNPELEDHQRPLNKRGYEDSLLMANILKRYNLYLDKVYCSTAQRAKSTIEILAKELNINSGLIEYVDDLYNASRRGILNFLKKLDDDLNNVAIVGHNPGLTDLAHFLLYDFDVDLPTCSIVNINLDIEKWLELKSGLGTLVFFEYPKKHK